MNKIMMPFLVAVAVAGCQDAGTTSQAPSLINPSPGLTDLTGARASSGEMALTSRGYSLAEQKGLTSYYWNATSGTCAEVVTGDGRYQSVSTVSPAQCGKTASPLPSSPPAMRSGSQQDEAACLSAVASQTGNTVSVTSSEFSEANTLVMVGVGPQKAPWKCLVSRGRVAEVTSMTDEGAL
ncbi:hypothetical protein HDIA_0365 [Hartmannibacter diazotrophicus]|uniref:Uncharacterized protein n=1 Tax=Hartmannibacter diazotrophicus TaxID=1482074 RepID=A0A2C9D0Y7_9HYPH|nr:hypothetical protein [Hartmannibacter diazotrophicus]SON53906.1 hypothetical protein HDIA_0365 [Hartmannibacter diazotrophicus]